MSVRNTVTSTRRSQLVPASSRMAFTFSNTLLHCTAMSWSTTLPWASRVTPGMSLLPFTRGPMPERKRRLPTRRAWGNAPTGAAARCEITRSDMGLIASLEIDADVLRLGEEAQDVQSALAADARVFHPPEGRAQVAEHPGVHPDDAALQPRGEAVGPAEVRGPHRGGQSVAHPVAGLEHLLLRIEGEQGGHRAEDLFLVGPAARGQALEEGRLDEPAVAAPAPHLGPLAPGEEAPPLVPRQRQIGEHLVQMGPAD